MRAETPNDRYVPQQAAGEGTIHSHAHICLKTCKNQHLYYRKKISNLELLADLERLSKVNSAKLIELIGKPGLRRRLPKFQAYRKEYPDADPGKIWDHLEGKNPSGLSREEFEEIHQILEIYEALTEDSIGEMFRFLLGDQQPKTRLVIQKEGLFVLSKYATEAKTYHEFYRFKRVDENLLWVQNSNQFYLNKLPEGLIYSLWIRNFDLHHNQILIQPKTDNQLNALFIDFGWAALGKTPEKKVDLTFNAQDIQFQPYVGSNGQKGGQYCPANWVGFYIYNKKAVGGNSYLELYENDPRTYKNPRFQLEKHRAILRLMLLPSDIASRFISRPLNALREFCPEGDDLFQRLKERLASELDVSWNDLIRESLKIKEFREYLKNVSLFEIADVAKEFYDYISKNNKSKQVQLGDILGQSPLEIFEIASIRLCYFLKIFGYEELLPFQLRLLTKENRENLIQLAFSSVSHSENPLAQFCILDERVHNGQSLEYAVENLVPFEDNKEILARIHLIQRVHEAEQLIQEILANFNVDIFFAALEYIANPTENKKPEIIRNDDSFTFLILDSITIQYILNHYFKDQESYEAQCLALRIQNIFEEKRKMSMLTTKAVWKLASYVSVQRSAELAQNLRRFIPEHLRVRESIVRNAMEFARGIPNKSEAQCMAIRVFGRCEGDPNLYSLAYSDQNPHSLFKSNHYPAFVALLNSLAFDFLNFKQEMKECIPVDFRSPEELAAYLGMRFIGEILNQFLSEKSNIPNIFFLEYPPNFIEKLRKRIANDDVEKFLENEVNNLQKITKNAQREIIRKVQELYPFAKNKIQEVFCEVLFFNFIADFSRRTNDTQVIKFLKKEVPCSPSIAQDIYEWIWNASLVSDAKFFKLTYEEATSGLTLDFILKLAQKMRCCLTDEEQRNVSKFLNIVAPRIPFLGNTYFQNLDNRKKFFDTLWRNDIFSREVNDYQTLILNRLSHPIFSLFAKDFWGSWEWLVEDLSDSHKEQLLIVHNLYSNPILNDAIYSGLKSRIIREPLSDNSAQFIFKLMSLFEPLSLRNSDIQVLQSSLFYALPYDSRNIDSYTTQKENSGSSDHPSANFLFTTKKILDSGVQTKTLDFNQQFLSPEEKAELLQRLQAEKDRQTTLKILEPNEYLNRREKALQNAYEFIQAQEKISWFTVDFQLRELARSRDINHHRIEWKNNFTAFFKTQARKEIDRIHATFVRSHRQKTLKSS